MNGGVLAKPIAYAQGHGTAVEQARLRPILCGVTTVARGLDRLESLRHNPGCWETEAGLDKVTHFTVEAVRALKLGDRIHAAT